MLDWTNIFPQVESKLTWTDGLWKHNPAYQNPASWYGNGQKIREWNHVMDENTQEALDAMDKYLNSDSYHVDMIGADRFFNHMDQCHAQPVKLPQLYQDDLITNSIAAIDFNQLQTIILLVLFVILVTVIGIKLAIIKYQRTD